MLINVVDPGWILADKGFICRLILANINDQWPILANMGDHGYNNGQYRSLWPNIGLYGETQDINCQYGPPVNQYWPMGDHWPIIANVGDWIDIGQNKSNWNNIGMAEHEPMLANKCHHWLILANMDAQYEWWVALDKYWLIWVTLGQYVLGTAYTNRLPKIRKTFNLIIHEKAYWFSTDCYENNLQ